MTSGYDQRAGPTLARHHHPPQTHSLRLVCELSRRPT